MPRPTRNRPLLLGTILAGQFMINMDITIANVAVPSIHRTLHASGAALELVVLGYVAAYALFFILSARLGERFGRRRLFLAGVAGFTLTSLCCALAPNAPALVVARVFQGASAAMLGAQVLSTIGLVFEGAARARAIGLWTLALSGAAVLGQAGGGLLVTADLGGMAWRPVFLINVPIGIVLLTLAYATFPRVQQRSNRTLWPLVHGAVLAHPAVRWGLGGYGVALSVYFALLFTSSLYLQQGHRRTPAFAGFTLLSWVAAFGLAGLVLPRLLGTNVRRLAPYGPLAIAAVFFAISALGASGLLAESALVTLLGIGGFAFGTLSNATVTNVTGALDKAYAADVSGLTGTNPAVSGTLGVALFGSLYLALGAQLGNPDRAFALLTATFALAELLASYCALRSLNSERRNPYEAYTPMPTRNQTTKRSHVSPESPPIIR